MQTLVPAAQNSALDLLAGCPHPAEGRAVLPSTRRSLSRAGGMLSGGARHARAVVRGSLRVARCQELALEIDSLLPVDLFTWHPAIGSAKSWPCKW